MVVVVVKELMSAGCYLCNGGGHGGGGGGPKFKGKAPRAGRGARGRVAVVARAGIASPQLLMHHLLGSGYQNAPISRSHSATAVAENAWLRRKELHAVLLRETTSWRGGYYINCNWIPTRGPARHMH